MEGSRFKTVTADEICAYAKKQVSQKTTEATHFAIKMLKEYGIQTNYLASGNPEDLEVYDLNKLLESFYVGVRNLKGGLYKTNTMKSIRSSGILSRFDNLIFLMTIMVFPLRILCLTTY